MKYKKSPLDRFLEQRINDNAKELKQTLNETLRMEQNCLEQIRLRWGIFKWPVLK